MNIQSKASALRRFFLSLNVFIFLIASSLTAQQLNTVESFTTANGLGNLACSDVLVEPNGSVWVTHSLATAPYNSQFPISRRDNLGNWTYPDLSVLPSPIVNGTVFNSNQFYQFNTIFRASNGDVWFLPKHHSLPNIDFDKTPPVVKYDGTTWSVYHSSLANFPNKGSVLSIAEDSQGTLWFGCTNGLISLNNGGVFSSFNPPDVVFTNGQVKQAKNANSITVDINDHIVMVTSEFSSTSGGGFFNWSCVRKFDPIANAWEDWHLSDAPWWNAVQVYYNPKYVVAMNDTANTINISTDGGGMYYIRNGQFASKDRTQIADFLKNSNGGWGSWGWAMENVYTNLPNFTRKVFRSKTNRFWILSLASGQGQNRAYRYEVSRPALWSGQAATQYAFSSWKSSLSRTQSGTVNLADIASMSFAENDTEVWFATEFGIERWYGDYPNPLNDFIGLEGVGDDKNGIVAWNNMGLANPESYGVGHTLVPGTPNISIDSAYYYIATRDYDNIDPSADAGLKGDGVVQGFGATQIALNAIGLGFEDLEIRFTPIHLGEDIEGPHDDWTYSNNLETRRYQKRILDEKDTTSEILSNYSILLNNQVLFKGPMPMVNLSIRFNKYGYLFDSIAGLSTYVHLSPNPSLTDPNLIPVRQALLQDIGQHGVRFNFRSIQSANDESLDSPDRQGGFFAIHHAMLEKGSNLLPPSPLAGKYIVGQSGTADYPDLTAAFNDLKLRGVDDWVAFSLESGVYTAQYILDSISGQQGFNQRFVRVGPVGSDSSTVTLEYTPQHIDSSFIFELNGIQNFKMSHIKLKNYSSDHSTIVKVEIPSSSLEIENCTFIANTNAANPIIDGQEFTHSYRFSENRFVNGNFGLSLKGNNGRIEDCIFKGQTEYAIKAVSGFDIHIANNQILGTDTGSFSGIHLVSVQDAFKLYNNRINNTTAECLIGINVGFNTSGFAAGNEYGEVFNNDIHVLGGANSSGMKLEGEEVKYYHNTVRIAGGDSTSAALYIGWAFQALDIQRSIFSSEEGPAIVSGSFPGFEANTNNNIYFSLNSNAFAVDDPMANYSTYPDLASFAAVANTDAQSLLADPQYVSASISVPANPLVWDRVAILPGFENDIEGSLRAQLCEPGAYEFDSAYFFVSPPIGNNCNSFGLQIEQNKRQLNFTWEPFPNAIRYRILRRPVGLPSWLNRNSTADTSMRFLIQDEGSWETMIIPLVGGQWLDSSCIAAYTINCLPIDYGSNILEPFGAFPDSSGSVLIRNVRGGTGGAPFDLWFWNTADSVNSSQRIQAVHAHEFNTLQGGQYVLKVVDRIGCSILDTFNLQLNPWNLNTPIITMASTIDSNTIQLQWNAVVHPGLRRYRVAYRNETDGQLRRTTFVVPGAQTTVDVQGLQAGKAYQFWVQARIDSGMGPQWGQYSAGAYASTASSAKNQGFLQKLERPLSYPNPFSAYIQLEFPSTTSFKVYDALGRVVFKSFDNVEQKVLNTESWSKGMYFIEFQMNDEIYLEKMIKQ